jgi:pimeloyl-ACP methyl ester carboxylesterase
VLYSHCVTQVTVSKSANATMPKADNRTPQDAIDGTASQDVLKLPDGHTITYHTIGNASLPLMLFVVGSSGLGSLYRRLSIELSANFQCVYYDKRGFLPADTDKTSVAEHTNQLVLASQNADDAAALIKHISPHTPICVFGTSTGGTAVLDLVVRYPELIHTAVLHEPITFSAMPPSELKDGILALYRCLPCFEDQVEGSKTYADHMFRPRSPETSSVLHANLSRVNQNDGVVPKRSTLPAESAAAFNARQGEQEGAAMLAYEVDIHRAKSVKDKILLVRGIESKGWPISQPVNCLAQALGDDVKVWELTGDHLSFAARRRVVTFAEQLVGILRQEGRVSFSTDSGPRSRL